MRFHCGVFTIPTYVCFLNAIYVIFPSILLNQIKSFNWAESDTFWKEKERERERGGEIKIDREREIQREIEEGESMKTLSDFKVI